MAGDLVRVVARAGDHGEDGSGGRVEGEYRALLVAESLGRRLLDLGHDGRLHAGALRRLVGRPVDHPPHEQRIVGAGQLGVVTALQGGPGMVVGVEAGHRRVDGAVGIDPLELEAVLGRLGLRDHGLPGSQDVAAVLGELGVPDPAVLWLGGQRALPEDHHVGAVGQQHREHDHGDERHPADLLIHASSRSHRVCAVALGSAPPVVFPLAHRAGSRRSRRSSRNEKRVSLIVPRSVGARFPTLAGVFSPRESSVLDPRRGIDVAGPSAPFAVE